MKQVKITFALLLVGLWSIGQTVTPNPGPYQNISTKYQYTWQKWSGGIWNLGKLVQVDSAQFSGVVYVPMAPSGDSSNLAASTKWAKENISPGIPGQPTPAWQFLGNYSPSDPTSGRLGFRDSFPLNFITDDEIRMIVPDNGIKRSAGLANKVLMIDTTTKKIYYADMGAGGGGTTSDQTLIATAAQTAFTFTSVPSSYADYIIFVNGMEVENTEYFTTSGNIVTFTTGLVPADRVRFKRIK